MGLFFLSFAASFFLAYWIISTIKDEAHWAADTTFVGAQKFHTRAVPRIGGVPIFTAVSVGSLMMWWQGTLEMRNAAAIVLCASPAFAIGLVEDLTKKVHPNSRMMAVCIAALLSWATIGVQITRVDVPWIDTLLQYSLVAMVLTIFAVAGIANAINIIDGFHGLALMTATLTFAAIASVAYVIGDALVMSMSLTAIGALLGVFVWNFPQGRIFLGDGGAYFVGFLLAQCGIMLFQRNPEVSPWFAVLVLAYPTVETLFSVYRKKVLRKISPMHPDRAHLHMLIFGRVVPRVSSSGSPLSKDVRNARTSPYLWALTASTLIPAVAFYDNPKALMFSFAGFALLYLLLYVRLVQFQSPYLPFGRSTVNREA